MTAPTIIAIRPEPGLAQTIARGSELGLEIAGFPLFEVRSLEWDAPDPARFGGLLLGSANAIRHGGPQLAQFLDLPVYAVGESTAAAATQAGFTVAATGTGGLQSLIEQLGGNPTTLLRIGGKDRIALNAPPGQQIVEIAVYQNCAVDAPEDLREALSGKPIVMLHSARAAVHFANQCSELAVNRAGIRIAALAPRIADAAGSGWASVDTAERAGDAALLALVENMCHL